MDNESKQADRKPVVGWLTLVVLGGLASVLVMAVPGNNSRPAHLAAWIVGAFYVGLVEALVWGGLLQRSKRSFGFRIASALAVRGFVGSFFMLTKDVAFNRAFGIDTPPCVRDLIVEGYYSRGIPGGMADLVIFLQFSVDQAGLQQILLERGFEHDNHNEQLWMNEARWSNEWLTEGRMIAWDSLFGGSVIFRDEAWDNIALPTRVEIYKWGQPASHFTRVLWDIDTGKAYVLYTLG